MAEIKSIVEIEESELIEGGLGSERITTIEHYRIGSIKTYEVADSELKVLESGMNSTMLNISISLFSMAVPLLISYLACSFPNKILEGVYISASFFLIVFALILLYIHHTTKRTARNIYSEIRNRTSY